MLKRPVWNAILLAVALSLPMCTTSGLAAVPCPGTTLPEPREGLALLVFIRPTLPASRTIFIYSGETFLGILENDTYAFTHVEPGRHLLWFNVAWDAKWIETEEGTTRYFRIYDHFEELDEDHGRSMVRDAGSCVTPEEKERDKSVKHVANVYPKVLEREGVYVGGITPTVEPPPRVIFRLDASLLGLPNVGAKGGGGITVRPDGTGAGLLDAGGLEIGAELRLWRWIALDASMGQYRPELQVARDRGDAMVDVRSATVDLDTLKVGLILTPPKWRAEWARGAIGVLLSTAKVSDPPAELGILVDESDTGMGVDFRGDFLFSKSGHWGVGVKLSFESLGPGFVDLETGATGSLQVSGLFLGVGLRGAW